MIMLYMGVGFVVGTTTYVVTSMKSKNKTFKDMSCSRELRKAERNKQASKGAWF